MTKPCCITSFEEARLAAPPPGPWGRELESPSKFLALHGWLLWLPGRCGMRSIWAVQELLPPPELICSSRAVAAGLSLRAAASGRREAGGGGRIQSSANEADARFI